MSGELGSESMSAAPLRVVQWATGNIGSRSLRQVIEHPGLELAGVYVTSDGGKAGQDAAGLCGPAGPAGPDRPAGPGTTGITATSDADAILALRPDCVLYMPAACDIGEVCRILESGANIVTTRGEFHHAPSMPPADRERVAAACAAGGTSIHSTGSSPGFISEALPIVLASIQRRLDGLTINEYADLSKRDSPDLLFRVMGYGGPAEKFDARLFGYGAVAFGPSMRLVAEAFGLPLDEVTSAGEVAVAARDTTIAAGTIKAGTVAAQRMTVTGSRGGTPLIRFVANWYCTKELERVRPGGPVSSGAGSVESSGIVEGSGNVEGSEGAEFGEWTAREAGWKVTVDGDAPLDIDIRFPFPLERMADMTPGYTANRAVNAVPYVCAAPPGIRTTVDLPQVVARLG
jgi:4-hydroxy-tetrahydrodipicolinate reductase